MMLKRPDYLAQRGQSSRRGNQKISLFYPFPCSAKRATALLEQLVKDQVIHLPYTDRFPSVVDQKVVSYCPYRQRRGHPLEQYVVSRRLFNESSKLARFYSQNVETLTSAKHLSQCIKIVEKVMK